MIRKEYYIERRLQGKKITFKNNEKKRKLYGNKIIKKQKIGDKQRK